MIDAADPDAETGGGSDGRSETVDGRQNRHPK